MPNTDILQSRKLLNNFILSQLSFAFQDNIRTDLFREEDFLHLEENVGAVRFLKKFFAQDNFNRSLYPSLIIKGEAASGKTHLLHIFAKKFNAEFVDKEKIAEINLVRFFLRNSFYILEDITEIKDEELLLQLINSAFEAGAFLILSSRGTPQVQLKDLASRLKNIFAVEIRNPTYESIKQLLAKGFSRRQIKVSKQIIDFISDNIDRSYEAALVVLKIVELRCEQNGKNLTMSEVREMIWGVVFPLV